MARFAQAACASPVGNAGQLQWIAASGAVKYCNGTTWVTMNNTNTGLTCSVAGVVQYVSSEIMFCNGTNWYRTAPVVNHGACAATLAGKFYYDSVGTYYWFCNGANWRRMGP
ncbi:hypothetical protein [Bdellovibrio sp. HCB2-146]|uniref:hypothetical protein n=1 Tax=Bdellovibrio sp. HCB2-146 TaxID=3394362 RepID=UPI0039BC9BC5